MFRDRARQMSHMAVRTRGGNSMDASRPMQKHPPPRRAKAAATPQRATVERVGFDRVEAVRNSWSVQELDGMRPAAGRLVEVHAGCTLGGLFRSHLSPEVLSPSRANAFECSHCSDQTGKKAKTTAIKNICLGAPKRKSPKEMPRGFVVLLKAYHFPKQLPGLLPGSVTPCNGAAGAWNSVSRTCSFGTSPTRPLTVPVMMPRKRGEDLPTQRCSKPFGMQHKTPQKTPRVCRCCSCAATSAAENDPPTQRCSKRGGEYDGVVRVRRLQRRRII